MARWRMAGFPRVWLQGPCVSLPSFLQREHDAIAEIAQAVEDFLSGDVGRLNRSRRPEFTPPVDRTLSRRQR
jgi:hypothetical protein